MKQPKLALTVLAVLGALAAQAHADDSLPITISGFGTGALTMTDTNDGLFNRVNQVGGAGKSARTGVDSNLGLQMTAKLSDNLSLTAQGLVRKNGPSDQFSGEMAWAFAKYKATDEISFRVGRIGLPVYMISDVRNVGYANIMMRAPNEVYRQVTADNIDGGDILYQHSFGDTTVTGQLAVGRTRFHASSNYDVEFKPAVSAQVVLENGPFTYRLGHAKAKVNVYDNANLNTLLAALNKYGLTSVVAELPLHDIDGTFTSAGISMDYNNIVLQGEYAKRKTETRAIQDTSSYYLMAGYRMGKFLPYVMHGDVKQDSIRSFASLPTTGPLAALTAAANGAIQAGLQSTTAIGVRWDFYKSAAFKFQIDHISTRDGTGYFVNAKPALAGKSVNVYAAGIDFVF
ncbi:porin [Pseudoduganella danionis]|uniref:Porin n=1 Tax=Pseudoduganella danionis TaxID=1890295 RepID=A0ABW9SRD0_9BURK|nr:porin [Pseudoduganella danionis]MTW34666.1 porin [Pseudoduganella danionis]